MGDFHLEAAPDDVISRGGPGQNPSDKDCVGGQGAGAAASSAVKGGGEGFPPGIHDCDGVHEEVPVGIACRAPGLVSPGLVGVPWQVRAGGCVHAGQTRPG